MLIRHLCRVDLLLQNIDLALQLPLCDTAARDLIPRGSDLVIHRTDRILQLIVGVLVLCLLFLRIG